MNASPPPFLFVVGVGRSGTTLLRSLLDTHSDLAVVHESRFIRRMAHHPSRYASGGDFDSARFLTDLFDADSPVRSRVHTWDVAPETIRAAVTEGEPPDLAAAIRLVYQTYAEARGKSRYGDKTPGYVESVASIATLLPEARFVHVVRDGRDVALSMMETDFGGTNVAHGAFLWARGARSAHAQGQPLGPTRYLVVHYDQLIDETERELERICRFINLPFETTMLQHHEHPDIVAKGLGAQPHHDHVRLPVTQGLREWRTQMKPVDVAAFEAVAGPVLVELGYELASPAGARTRTRRVAAELRIAEGRVRAVWHTRRRRRQRR